MIGDKSNPNRIQIQIQIKPMSVAIPDPDETDSVALDDRNREIFNDPDFEMNEKLAYGIGYSEPDPANDEGNY